MIPQVTFTWTIPGQYRVVISPPCGMSNVYLTDYDIPLQHNRRFLSPEDIDIQERTSLAVFNIQWTGKEWMSFVCTLCGCYSNLNVKWIFNEACNCLMSRSICVPFCGYKVKICTRVSYLYLLVCIHALKFWRTKVKKHYISLAKVGHILWQEEIYLHTGILLDLY